MRRHNAIAAGCVVLLFIGWLLGSCQNGPLIQFTDCNQTHTTHHYHGADEPD